MIAKTDVLEQSGFLLVGVTIRTSNQHGQSQKDIGGLWSRIMGGNLLAQINDKASDDTYCVYTDYETDYTGYYTTLIGCRVNSLENIPEGFTGLAVPGGKYQVYGLTGKFPENVHNAWQQIWKSGVERKYAVDYDLYRTNAKNFEETEVKICLSII
jgi:predicted transcriptional regulator YdeE